MPRGLARRPSSIASLLVMSALLVTQACSRVPPAETDTRTPGPSERAGTPPGSHHEMRQIGEFVAHVDTEANTLLFENPQADGAGENGRTAQALTEITV